MPELSTKAKEKLLELKQEYVRSFPEKIEEINECWNKNNLDELRMQCHKIAGSSASFEFPDVSFAAKTLEALCKTRSDNNRAKSIQVKHDKTLMNAYTVLIDVMHKYR